MDADQPLVFALRIHCGNDAFQPSPRAEVARMLRHCADALDDGALFDNVALLDANGNSVGVAQLAPGAVA